MSILLRTSSKDGLSIYRKHHLYAIMLEALADKQYCEQQNLFHAITGFINEEIKWNATMADINAAVIYLIFIGMIEVHEDTFFNYRSMKKLLIINILKQKSSSFQNCF